MSVIISDMPDNGRVCAFSPCEYAAKLLLGNEQCIRQVETSDAAIYNCNLAHYY